VLSAWHTFVTTHFLATSLGKKIFVPETDPIYSSKMGANTKLDKDNIITASLEELNEEERKDYLVAEEYLKAQFLKGFKKNWQGTVTRVQDFVMPSFTLKNKQIEVISNVSTSSSNLLDQLSSIMNQKIADSHKSTSNLLASLTDELHTLKRGKSVDDNSIPAFSPKTVNPSSWSTLVNALNPQYGMPLNYFAGQSPPP
jgi:hypothetical protein